MRKGTWKQGRKICLLGVMAALSIFASGCFGGSKEKSIREKLRNARNQIDERIYQDAAKLADAEMGEFTAKRTEKQKRQDKEQERQ